MAQHPTVTRLEDFAPDLYGSDPESWPDGERIPAKVKDCAFEAGLRYIAADLCELAKTAPPNKSESMFALVRLVQTLAET